MCSYLYSSKTHLGKVRYAQEKAYGVQNVGLATTIQPSDGIEKRVKTADFSPLGVRLEPIQYNLLNEHLR